MLSKVHPPKGLALLEMMKTRGSMTFYFIREAEEWLMFCSILDRIFGFCIGLLEWQFLPLKYQYKCVTTYFQEELDLLKLL